MEFILPRARNASRRGAKPTKFAQSTVEFDRTSGTLLRMTIAIIGASSRRHKFANKAVRAWLLKNAKVFPIHPQETEVEGLPVFRSVEEVPDEIEVASFYVPPSVGITLLAGCARKGIRILWLNPGSASPELLRRAAELSLQVEQTCSIVRAGFSPSQFTEE